MSGISKNEDAIVFFSNFLFMKYEDSNDSFPFLLIEEQNTLFIIRKTFVQHSLLSILNKGPDD